MVGLKNWHKFVIFGIIIILLAATSYFIIDHANLNGDPNQKDDLKHQLSQSEKQLPERPVQESESSLSLLPEVASSTVLGSDKKPSKDDTSAAPKTEEPAQHQKHELEPIITETSTPIPISANAIQVTSGAPIPQNERYAAELDAWHQFKTRYNKNYANNSEELERMSIFNENRKFITEFNEKQAAQFKLGVNKFADLKREEINQLYFGPTTQWSSMQTPPPLFILREESTGPKEVDWRNLTQDPVDQGLCRDSAVFAAVASIESAFNRKFQPMKAKLSEMQVIDCMKQQSQTQQVCSGENSMVQVFDLLQRNSYSLTTPEIYKMHSDNGIKCQIFQETTTELPVAKLGSYMSINRNNILEALFNSGPLSVAIDATQSTYHFYQSGLYHDENCSTETYNHHAVLVGYSSATDGDISRPYYILRNSFGVQWGESGHMRLLKDEKRNKCLPQNMAIFPSIAN